MINRVLIISQSEELEKQIHQLENQLGGSFKFQQVALGDLSEESTYLTPDHILLDAPVVQEEGIEAVRKLLQHDSLGKTPVILLTEDPEEDKLSKLLSMGISDFILKPLNKDKLLYRLKTLEKHRQSQSGKNIQRNVYEINGKASEIESTINAVVRLYPDGKAESVNGGFEQIYECPFEDYLESYGHYIFSENSEGFRWALEKFKNGEQGLTLEHQIQTKSDQSKWIQTTLTPLTDEQGNLNKIIAVETDISRLYVEKKKTEELLANLFPYEISEQLKRKGKAKSKKYRMVTVLFADFENFTTLTKTMTVDELITELNRYVRKFDEIIEDHYLEKIKTMGDAYMCAGGLPLKNYSNPFDVTLASLEIQKFVSDMANVKVSWGERPWKLRLGIHTGRVMAGVIGTKKFAYDIWGNTVNIASRMEETGQVGKVNISGTTYEYIKDYFECTYRGKINIKNNAEDIDMYYVDRLKPEFAEDDEGIFPNEKFRKILAQY